MANHNHNEEFLCEKLGTRGMSPPVLGEHPYSQKNDLNPLEQEKTPPGQSER
jgi:hypothetical protein